MAGHVSSDWRSTVAAISITGAHVLTAVGIGTALNDRRRDSASSTHERFSDSNAIAFTELGESTFAQGEVMEAVTQAGAIISFAPV